MLLDKRKREWGGEIPLCSTADIAFLLLIFFLVTTTMDTDKGIPMVLPERGGEVRINPKNIAKILVNEAGEVLFEDRVVSDGELAEALVNAIKERGVDPTDGNPRLIVSIKTDRNTDYDRYIAVLDIVKGSGATKISIAEPDKE